VADPAATSRALGLDLASTTDATEVAEATASGADTDPSTPGATAAEPDDSDTEVTR
jgi:hypothetical protein